MKWTNRLNAEAVMAAFLGLLLVGCSIAPLATTKGSEYSTAQFSIGSPPDGWETIDDAEAVSVWRNKATNSRILIHRLVPNTISYSGRVQLITNTIEVVSSEKYRNSSITLEGESDTPLNSKTFYQATWNYTVSPVDGLQVSGKIRAYFLKTADLEYVFTLIAIQGHYEKDRLVVENMLQSIAFRG